LPSHLYIGVGGARVGSKASAPKASSACISIAWAPIGPAQYLRVRIRQPREKDASAKMSPGCLLSIVYCILPTACLL
jgi:hypothetical protein